MVGGRDDSIAKGAGPEGDGLWPPRARNALRMLWGLIVLLEWSGSSRLYFFLYDPEAHGCIEVVRRLTAVLWWSV